MPVPDFQSFMLPLLQRCTDANEHTLAEFRATLSKDLAVTEEETKEKLPSGKQTKYENRIYWAAIYLHRAGCLERIRRGTFKITPRGKALLEEKHPKITVKILSQFPEFKIFHNSRPEKTSSASAASTEPAQDSDDSQTPEEVIENGYAALQESLASELLETLKKLSPKDFEGLVVELLVAMGYGGSIQDAGEAVGKSGDEGIDGIIKEDKLGLDNIYIQAKKWSDTTVGRPIVQAFAGSLEGHRARKGVMITTSSFSDDARTYVQKIEKKIVLIDGKQLAQLMIDHNVGVVVTKSYTIKKVDQEYFGQE